MKDDEGESGEEQGDDYEDEDGDDAMPAPRKPYTRTAQKLEKEAPQKWVQCAKCELWRKVSTALEDLGSNGASSK